MASTGRGSQNKGSQFERTIAKQLSSWWGYTFYRSPGSGSLHWSSSTNTGGDIVAPLEAGFPFVVECKNHEDWTIENLFLNNKEPKAWWKQVVSDALEYDKIPMLIFTRNRAKKFVTLPYNKELVKHIESREFPCMVSNIEFKDDYGDYHCYKTMTTILEAVTSFRPVKDKDTMYFKWYFRKDRYNWKDALIRETKKVQNARNIQDSDAEGSIDDLLDNI